jgi:hypothetical protein
MQYRKVLRPKDQLTLFQQRPVMPSWRDFPAEVREQTVQLLAKILRQHRERPCAGVLGREVRDE